MGAFGELLVALLEAVASVVEWSFTPPRPGDRYRVKHRVEVIGHIESGAEAPTCFRVLLDAGAIVRLERDPREAEDLVGRVDGRESERLIPTEQKASAAALGWRISLSQHALKSNFTRVRQRWSRR